MGGFGKDAYVAGETRARIGRELVISLRRVGLA